MPILTVVAGPNGAGKTRFSQFLFEQKIIPVLPFNPDVVDLEFPSMISQFLSMECEAAVNKNIDFSFECNLRKGQLQHINQFQERNYTLNLVYLFLDNIQLSEERVKYRVEVEKGNFVNQESIRENFYSGLINLDNTFDIWDHLLLINNSRKVELATENNLEYSLGAKRGKIMKVQNHFPPEHFKPYLPILTAEIEKYKSRSLDPLSSNKNGNMDFGM